MKKPNILILMSDEHRADIAGYNGNTIVRTPTLDALAQKSCVFDNAYAPSPICVPSRQCFMSGQLPKTCGCDGSWMDLKPGYDTFAKRFSQYAYKTTVSGKLHHIGADQMQGWTERLASDTHLLAKYVKGLLPEEFKKYQNKILTEKKTNEQYVKEASVAFGPYQAFDARAFNEATSYIEKYFDGNDESKQPLVLKVSFLQPHYPFHTDQEKFDYYHDKVPLYTDETCDHPVLSQSQMEAPVSVSDDEIRNTTATYYGMIETIDSYYGSILKSLEDAGQNLDDWIIVYLSDHGEMLGEHGIWEKARFYESSVKVPLMIKMPSNQYAGTRLNQNVNLCDVYSTLCDIADITIPPNLDSRTLLPLISGDTNWDNETVSQIKRGTENHVMIKHGDLKYQYYGESIPEVLFDLKSDPGEKVNKASDPAYKEAMLTFQNRLAELGYGANPCSTYTNAGYECGVEVRELGEECIFPEDSNPWKPL